MNDLTDSTTPDDAQPNRAVPPATGDLHAKPAEVAAATPSVDAVPV
ncbi:hypothetical protein G3N92_05425, partial [Burkholderia sp. Ac-20379]|nr:hypothetical protein [Burkholderia sp. Ac-20379]